MKIASGIYPLKKTERIEKKEKKERKKYFSKFTIGINKNTLKYG